MSTFSERLTAALATGLHSGHCPHHAAGPLRAALAVSWALSCPALLAAEDDSLTGAGGQRSNTHTLPLCRPMQACGRPGSLPIEARMTGVSYVCRMERRGPINSGWRGHGLPRRMMHVSQLSKELHVCVDLPKHAGQRTAVTETTVDAYVGGLWKGSTVRHMSNVFHVCVSPLKHVEGLSAAVTETTTNNRSGFDAEWHLGGQLIEGEGDIACSRERCSVRHMSNRIHGVWLRSSTWKA